ncbi:MAG TPA: tyrosine recombinase XerC [Burkholderiales bacterium]|jgi:integrase/recombinase XerC|nr:tyrosine recombinase XerC [Burkholderiales bacterium]
MNAPRIPDEPGARAADRRLSGFLAYLEKERRLSAHTVKNYARDVQRLLELAEHTPLEDIRTHHVRRFVARLHAQGLHGRSLARLLSAWRAFFRYLARDHGFRLNPCGGVRAPRAEKRLPAALSPEEAARLVELPERGPLSVRDRAILELFYSSGLRLSELTSLCLGDVDFAQATVRVLGKGGKTRIVPVGRFALEALKNWLAARVTLAVPEEQALFVNQRGKRLGARGVEERVRAWAIKQGLSSGVHPHMLRHSFASHILQSSGDLRAVQEMLGHASISTTQVYTHLDWQHLARVYDVAHPRAKRKSSKV